MKRPKKNYLLDTRLSWKAKGLLTYLLTLPKNWHIHVNELLQYSTDRHQAIYSALHELINHGYVKTEQTNKHGNFLKYYYKLTDFMPKNPVAEKRRAVTKTEKSKTSPGRRKAASGKGSINKAFEDNSEKLNEQSDPLAEKRLLYNLQLSTNKLVNKDSKQSILFENIPRLPKSGDRVISKRGQEYIRMQEYLEYFLHENISDNELSDLIKKYYNQRRKKNLQIDGLKIILDDLIKFGGKTKQQKESVRNALAGGYLQIIPYWQKTGNKRFENSSDKTDVGVDEMTDKQKEKFEKSLVKDENGQLVSF